MRLQDKVAVVTGAGSGIGLAIARRFVAEGARVIAVDWNAEAVVAAASDIGGTIIGITGNIADEADSVAMIDRAITEFGRLDILVNNAGVMDLFESVADVSNATWRRCMSVNVDGPMYAMRRAVPLMLAQGGGSIVNIASVAAIGGGAAGAAYTASKHALIGLTRNTAYQYARLGLRCNALAVGGVSTNIMDSVKGQHSTRRHWAVSVPTMPAIRGCWSRTISPMPCCFSPPTRPIISMAPCCRWIWDGALREGSGSVRIW